MSPNGELVALGGHRDTRIYRDSTLWGTISTANIRPSGMNSLKFADDQTLIVNSLDAVQFYSIPQRKIVRQLPLNRDNDRAIILLDKILVQEFNGSTFNHVFRLYDIDAHQGSKPIAIHPSPHVSTEMSSTNDGRFVAFFWGNADVEFLQGISEAATYQIFDLESQTSSAKLPSAAGIQFTPDNSSVLVCGNAISLFDWPSLTRTWTVNVGSCHDIRFSPNGNLFAVSNHDNDRLYVFETNTGIELTKIELEPANGSGFAFTEDGKSIWLPGLGDSGGIRKWRIDSGQTVQRIGNSDDTRWLMFLIVFIAWAYCLSRTIAKASTEITRSTSLWLSAAAKTAIGVVAMAIGILCSISKLPLDQHVSLTTYITALVFMAFILIVANWILISGFSSFTQAFRLRALRENHAIESLR
ncbi:MAG: hypothetical protein Aurels2KO_51930 [Aureliella sp.]